MRQRNCQHAMTLKTEVAMFGVFGTGFDIVYPSQHITRRRYTARAAVASHQPFRNLHIDWQALLCHEAHRLSIIGQHPYRPRLCTGKGLDGNQEAFE